jgi:hypothetical protein
MGEWANGRIVLHDPSDRYAGEGADNDAGGMGSTGQQAECKNTGKAAAQQGNES